MTSEELRRTIQDAYDTVMNMSPRTMELACQSGLMDRRLWEEWKRRHAATETVTTG